MTWISFMNGMGVGDFCPLLKYFQGLDLALEKGKL